VGAHERRPEPILNDDDFFYYYKKWFSTLIEGLCAQIYFIFEISVVLLTSSSFLLCERKNMFEENKKAVSPYFYL